MSACAQLLHRQTTFPCAAILAAQFRRCTSPRQLHVQNSLLRRWFPRRAAVANARLSTATSSPTPASDTTVHGDQRAIKSTLDDASKDATYYGPLTATFRRLKMFSLSSLGLTLAVTPLMFIMETTSALPLTGRFVLAGIAVATSGVSTALISWCGKPYVTKLRWLEPEGTPKESTRALEMTTFTLRLRERITRVYDTAFLVPASRPFATWELAEMFQLPKAEAAREKSAGLLPREETIAETTNKDGKVIGRWIVNWSEDGMGRCREIGRVARYFNVHEELLDRPIR